MQRAGAAAGCCTAPVGPRCIGVFSLTFDCQGDIISNIFDERLNLIHVHGDSIDEVSRLHNRGV
eukprot:2023841-Pyramimonas_sp.AAC.1